MAELNGSTQIVKSEVAGDGYALSMTEYDASGKPNGISIPVPRDERWGSIMLTAAVLKNTTWAQSPIPQIIHAIMYAEQMGLDIIAGDVYLAEGRLATTASAKIRHAMASGRIEGYRIDIVEGPQRTFKYTQKNADKEFTHSDLKAHVEVRVKGWPEPVCYDTTLGEWFQGRNPNWTTRPAYMLRRNALSKALEEVAPMGVESDEAPSAV